MARPVRLASCCSSHFHRRRRAPLLPPASAVITSDWASAIRRTAHLLPPAPNRLHGEGRGVVIDPDAHPAFVPVQVVDAVRNGLAAGRGGGRDHEVMDPHALRRFRRTPRAARILEIPDQFLLLRVDRNRGLVLSLGRSYASRDIPKLRISVDVLAAFPRLHVALQAVAQAMQQFGDHGVADVMAQPLKRHRQGACAQARPAQRRVRIAGRRRLHQRVQVPQQRGIALGGSLATPTGLPAPRAGQRVARCEFTQASLNGRRRDPRRARHLRDTTVADRLGFRRRPHPARSLRQHGRQSRMLGSQGGQIHSGTVPLVDQQYKLLIPDRP